MKIMKLRIKIENSNSRADAKLLFVRAVIREESEITPWEKNSNKFVP